ncbi:phosphate signaling complex protein PhoU [Fusibacter sp. JL216-2]|uniref:phosphate signaling complex protein PhoU n=1 Tax=Fusibacter sp. JL216-2 TaxID=3071453 RepID=UPI003D331AA4
MREQLDYNIKELDALLLKMSSQVEEIIELSIKALMEQDLDLANRIIRLDNKIDNMEISIEKKSLELIALQNPIAGDLRRVSAILKIITDLERIGDHCVNIAKVVIDIGKKPFIKPLIDIPKMAEIVRKMVNESIDSFVQANSQLAIEVAKRDDEVDALYETIYLDLLEFMRKDDVEEVDQIVNLLFIGRYLERIADHTTNICERIIYMSTGERMNF